MTLPRSSWTPICWMPCLKVPDPEHKAKEIEIKVVERLRRHMGNPRYRKLSERLEKLKEQHEAGQLHSIAFLKALLDLAKDLVNAEKEVPAGRRRRPRQSRPDRALSGSSQSGYAHRC